VWGEVDVGLPGQDEIERGLEFKGKFLEACQSGKASDDILGRKVPGMRNTPKGEAEEVSRTQK
jgi:hypothetical protein